MSNQLLTQLATDPYRKAIFTGITDLIEIRKQETAFDPYGEQEVLASAPEIFAIKRGQGQEQITSYTNVSNREVTIENVVGTNVITHEKISGTLTLPPYGYGWIKKG